MKCFELRHTQFDTKSSMISSRGDGHLESPSRRRPCAAHVAAAFGSSDFLARDLNVGGTGGDKKKSE